MGSLIPSQEFTCQIPSETEATVVEIRLLPGSQVKADSILLEMSNPQAEQAALDAQASVESGRSRISESACQASERFDEPEGQRCATPGRVTRMIVLQASAWIMVGAAARVHGSFVVTHWIRCLLFGIQPNNPAILPEAAVLLLAAAFVMGLDCRVPRGPGPMVALRYE